MPSADVEPPSPSSDSEYSDEPPGFFQRLKRLLLGRPRDVADPTVFHQVSLIALLAWVGLGADGLSSSAYGPEEAFRALGDQSSSQWAWRWRPP